VAAAASGAKERLLIKQCTVEEDGTITLGSKEFTVMLNPSSYTHTHKITYARGSIFGQLGSDVKFAQIGEDTVSFQVIIDGTGVVAPGSSGSYPDVKTQLQKLQGVVYDYQGVKHEPSVVRLLWGTMIFFGRMTKMEVEHTLFKPSGAPLRAKVKLDFIGFMSKEKEALVANRSSSDLSHSVEVRDGDTLPLLCYRIYKDSSRYAEVARFNNMTAFRKLEPGTRISFPPLTSDQGTRAEDGGVRKYPRAAAASPLRRSPIEPASA
jgi:hypothetical protein